MKKKFFCLVLFCVMSLFLVACGSNPDQESQQTIDNSQDAVAVKNILKELYEKYCSGEEYAIKDFMITDRLNEPFTTLFRETEGEYISYFERENTESKFSKGIVLYKGGKLFIGEFENGKLKGIGKCYSSFKVDDVVILKHIEGSFENGIPNGYCTEFQDVFGTYTRISFINEGYYDMAVRTGTFKKKDLDYTPMDYYSFIESNDFSYKNEATPTKEIVFEDVCYVEGVAQINEACGMFEGDPLASRGVNEKNYYLKYNGEKETAFMEEW